HGGDVGERHQGLEDRHGRVVGAGRTPVDRETHHHVVEHVDVVVADLLDRPGETHDPVRAFTVRHARKLDGELHGCTAATAGRDCRSPTAGDSGTIRSALIGTPA